MASNISTGERTYFLALSSLSVQGEILNIPFRDTSGNIIKCNYFKVDIANNNLEFFNGTLVAEPSGVSMAGTIISNNITQINRFYNRTDFVGLNGSGICGVGTILGGGNKGSVEWHGSNGEVCTGLRLEYEANFFAGTTTIIGIIYGNLLPFNDLRANSYSNAYDKGA